CRVMCVDVFVVIVIEFLLCGEDGIQYQPLFRGLLDWFTKQIYFIFKKINPCNSVENILSK
ncbi:hypothetical protein, partial [Campylobacter coli]|uniref:hypothetical protein n=1 Tax=Campylobacter coli TaxID=195 RepID=UPI003818B7C3